MCKLLCAFGVFGNGSYGRYESYVHDTGFLFANVFSIQHYAGAVNDHKWFVNYIRTGLIVVKYGEIYE